MTLATKFYLAVFCLISWICVAACDRQRQAPETPPLTISVFNSEYGGYGYDIYRGEVRLIHQPHIPATQGTKGFQTRKKAKRAALLVLKKLESGGDMPPALTVRELEEVGAI